MAEAEVEAEAAGVQSSRAIICLATKFAVILLAFLQKIVTLTVLAEKSRRWILTG